MKKLGIFFLMPFVILLVLTSCTGDKKVDQTTNPDVPEVTDKELSINDFVMIKEEANKEALTPNGDMARYIYEIPIINIEKPTAQIINNRFLNLEKDMEKRIGDGQNLTLLIKSKAFLNDGIISIVMEIQKPGPEGIHVANYDIEKDIELSTKKLLERYDFDPQKLLTQIKRKTNTNIDKPEEEQDFFSIDYFIETIITNTYDNSPSNEHIKQIEEMQNKTIEEKEKFVIENIHKINAYINGDGKIVFIHRGALADQELVVE